MKFRLSTRNHKKEMRQRGKKSQKKNMDMGWNIIVLRWFLPPLNVIQTFQCGMLYSLKYTLIQ